MTLLVLPAELAAGGVRQEAMGMYKELVAPGSLELTLLLQHLGGGVVVAVAVADEATQEVVAAQETQDLLEIHQLLMPYQYLLVLVTLFLLEVLVVKLLFHGTLNNEKAITKTHSRN